MLHKGALGHNKEINMDRLAIVDFSLPQFDTYNFTNVSLKPIRRQVIAAQRNCTTLDLSPYLTILYDTVPAVHEAPITEAERSYLADVYRSDLYGAGTIRDFVASERTDLVRVLIVSKRLQHLQHNLRQEFSMYAEDTAISDEILGALQQDLMNLEVQILELSLRVKI